MSFIFKYLSLFRIAPPYNKVELSQLFVARRGSENEPRNIAIYLARQIRGEPLKKIGESFNLNRVSSVSSVFERVKRKMGTDKKFRKKVEDIKGILYKGRT